MAEEPSVAEEPGLVKEPDERGISRRTILLGGGALAVAAAVGGAQALRGSGIRTWVNHAQGKCDVTVPHPAASGARIDRGTFTSQAMQGDLAYVIARPAGTKDGESVPVVVCLHGHGQHAGVILELDWPDHAAAAGGRYALAAVDGSDRYWHRRRDGFDPERMIVEEWVPFLASRFSLTTRAVMGWSMGGFGALHLARRHRDVFPAGAVANSPALWRSFGEASAADSAAFDDEADFLANDVRVGAGSAASSIPTMVTYGRSDFFVAGIEDYLRAVGDGGSHVDVVATNGCHDQSFWRAVAPQAAKFLGARLRSA